MPRVLSHSVVPPAVCVLFAATGISAQQTGGAPACRFEEVARSSAQVDLSYVTAIATDSRGRVYVGDRFIKSVVVLDDSGRFVRHVGRQGAGPGEFSFVQDLDILPGDSLAVYDIEHGRLTVFDPDSFAVARTLLLGSSVPALGRPPFRVLLFPVQRRIVAIYLPPFRPGQDPRQDYRQRQVVHVLNWGGELVQQAVLELPGPQQLVRRSSGAVGIALFPFGETARIAAGPGGLLYYGRGDSLDIRMFDLSGTQVGRYTRQHQSPRITEDDLRWASTRVSEMFRETLREAAPQRWPAFRQFAVDDAGRMWIGLETPRGHPTMWRVVERQGRDVCQGALPEDLEVKLVRADRLYGVLPDALDVPRIVVYRWSAGRAQR